MTKKDFIKRITKMGSPKLEEFFGHTILLSTYWIIQDKENFKIKFCLPMVKLLHSEYKDGNLSGFYNRKELARRKYKKWLQELKQSR